MIAKLSLITLALALVTTLVGALGPTASAASSPPPSILLSGRTVGLFNLPNPAGPGAMVGKFQDASGVPQFAVKAAVLASPAGGGALVGTVTLLVGPLAGLTYDLRGTWQAGSSSRGSFKGAILTQPSPGRPVVRKGSLAGLYQDTPGSVGTYAGSWRLRP